MRPPCRLAAINWCCVWIVMRGFWLPSCSQMGYLASTHDVLAQSEICVPSSTAGVVRARPGAKLPTQLCRACALGVLARPCCIAVCSVQGIGRRTRSVTFAASVADRIALQNHKSSGSVLPALQNARASIMGGRHWPRGARACVGLCHGPTPAKGVRAVLEAFFG